MFHTNTQKTVDVVVCRSLMYSEANRRETFTSWPHAGYRWAQPDPMAQAGFYHQVCSEGHKLSSHLCSFSYTFTVFTSNQRTV